MNELCFTVILFNLNKFLKADLHYENVSRVIVG